MGHFDAFAKLAGQIWLSSTPPPFFFYICPIFTHANTAGQNRIYLLLYTAEFEMVHYVIISLDLHRVRFRRITSFGSITTCCWTTNRNVPESKSKRTRGAGRTVSWRSRTPTSRIRATTPVARPAASPTPSTSKFWPVLYQLKVHFFLIRLLRLYIR